MSQYFFDSMSQPSSSFSSPLPSAAGNPAQRGKTRFPRPLFLIVFFGILAPYGLIEIPREIGRWHLANAYQLRAANEAEGAYQRLEAATYWFPNSAELLLQRAEWKLEDGKKDEALADCDAMLAAGGESHLWLIVHASFLQHAGHFEGAVDDWKKIEQFSQRSGIPDRGTALNGLAYSQALAKKELDEALENVNEALDLEKGNPNILDTRGFVRFLRDDYDAALVDLDSAVAGLDKAVERADGRARAYVTPELFRKAVTLRPKRLLEIAPPDEQTKREMLATAAAVVHYHRSLVLTAMDRKEDAEKDREIARRLAGREPDETLF